MLIPVTHSNSITPVMVPIPVPHDPSAGLSAHPTIPVLVLILPHYPHAGLSPIPLFQSQSCTVVSVLVPFLLYCPAAVISVLVPFPLSQRRPTPAFPTVHPHEVEALRPPCIGARTGQRPPPHGPAVPPEQQDGDGAQLIHDGRVMHAPPAARGRHMRAATCVREALLSTLAPSP